MTVRTIKKSVKKTIVVTAMVVFLGLGGGVYTPSAHAGIPVIDVANLASTILNFIENLLSEINSVEQIVNQIEGIGNQVKSLENEAKNLANMDLSNSFKNPTSFKTTLFKIKGALYSAKGLPLRYEAMEDKYGKLYKDVGGYEAGTFDDWSKQAKELQGQTNYAVYDAMKTQGMIEEMESDTENIEDLLKNSDSAQGALEVAQVSNQLGAVNTRQLMRMQTIQSAAYRLQASQIGEEVQRREIAMADHKRVLTGIKSMDDPLKTSPSGEGFKEIH
jgi:P-type conjugative transfer protein TrbJ